MKKMHKRRYLDVSVMHCANCNTDHGMLRVKVVIKMMKTFRTTDVIQIGVRRWEVMKLKGSCTDETGRETSKGSFVRVVEEKLQNEWEECNSVQEKWDTWKAALCDRAKTA